MNEASLRTEIDFDTFTSIFSNIYKPFYLASPYTKYPDGTEAAFKDISKLSAKFIEKKVLVFSPIVHCHVIAEAGSLDKLDGDFWISVNYPMLNICPYLIVACLPSWEDSKGIKEEVEFFHKKNRAVFYVDPNTLRISGPGFRTIFEKSMRIVSDN